MLPARFIVPALCGDAGTLDGLTDLNDLQDAVLAAAPRPDTEQYSDEYYEVTGREAPKETDTPNKTLLEFQTVTVEVRGQNDRA